MKWFAYNEVGFEMPVILSEEQIKNYYYQNWKTKMIEFGKPEKTTWENCLEDWIVTHWAWEIATPNLKPEVEKS